MSTGQPSWNGILRWRGGSSRRGAFWLGVVVALLLLCLPATALSGPRRVYWRLAVDAGISESDAKSFRRALTAVVTQAEEEHLLTESQLIVALRDGALHVPSCFEGLKPCGALPEQLVELLGVDALVDGRLLAVQGGWQLELALYRDFGGTPRVVTETDADLERLARKSVGQLFTLEALVTVFSDPPGAVLYANGRKVGETPARFQAQEGQHALRVEAEGYEAYREEVQLLPGEQREVRATLTPKLTQVTVFTAAAGATVLIDGVPAGEAGAPIDVMPGRHALELRAEGYRNIGITFGIDAAQRRTINLAMLPIPEDPWVRRARGVRRYRLYTEGGYDLMFQGASFDGTSATVGGQTYSPGGFGGGDRADLTLQGLQLGVGYTGEHWGVLGLGLAFMGSGLEEDLTLRRDGTTPTRAARATGTSRVALYPAQATGRYPFGPVYGHLRTGFGVGFDTLEATLDDAVLEFSETQMFWELGAAARYYWSEEWYAQLGYRIEVDFGGDRGTRHGLMAGVGFNLPVWTTDGAEAAAGDAAPTQLDDEGSEVAPASPGDATEAAPGDATEAAPSDAPGDGDAAPVEAGADEDGGLDD